MAACTKAWPNNFGDPKRPGDYNGFDGHEQSSEDTICVRPSNEIRSQVPPRSIQSRLSPSS